MSASYYYRSVRSHPTLHLSFPPSYLVWLWLGILTEIDTMGFPNIWE